MTGFYMKCNTGLKWIKVLNVVLSVFKVNNQDTGSTLRSSRPDVFCKKGVTV